MVFKIFTRVQHIFLPRESKESEKKMEIIQGNFFSLFTKEKSGKLLSPDLIIIYNVIRKKNEN